MQKDDLTSRNVAAAITTFTTARRAEYHALRRKAAAEDGLFDDYQAACRAVTNAQMAQMACIPMLRLAETDEQYRAFRLAGQVAEQTATTLELIDLTFFWEVLHDPLLLSAYEGFTEDSEQQAQRAFTIGIADGFLTRRAARFSGDAAQQRKQLADEKASRNGDE